MNLMKFFEVMFCLVRLFLQKTLIDALGIQRGSEVSIEPLHATALSTSILIRFELMFPPPHREKITAYGSSMAKSAQMGDLLAMRASAQVKSDYLEGRQSVQYSS